jgi:hypothetical protein
MISTNFSKKDLLKKIKLPKKITPQLAELCGIHIGDGYLGHRPNKKEYLVQCTGNLKDDKAHYDLHIRKLWKKLFNLNVTFNERKDNTYELRVYSKAIALFFNEFLQLPFGKKSRTIRIPEIIKKTCSKKKVSDEMKACLRGIIDTDFYFVSDRGSPELGAWFASRNLIIDLFEYFKLLGLEPKIRLDVEYFNKSSNKMLIRHQIRVRRKQDIKKWFEIIETGNPKIYKRYLEFMK